MAAMAIAALMTTGLSARAQPAPPAEVATVPAPRFAVKGFRLVGENPLGEVQAAQVLAPYVRADATLETLQQAATALETAMRDRGFGLHRVALSPQSVGDTVLLTIVHFSVASVKVEGASLYDEANILRSLPDLQIGSTPNFKRLAVQTAIANENQGKQIQLGVKESAESDKVDASILVKETRLWNLTAGINNNGSAATGQDRFTVAATHSNMLKLDHQFSAAYTTSLEHSSNVKQLGLSYRMPLYSLGVWGPVIRDQT
ncbi:MAG: ShlB/FhaC/HecB family hemolysin secretion/activation protein [Betaproteobacteria bacterium]|nr:ShlB/FhaC/HecB family hemolysin secretion/activation protein [Betaproteobacteria bacterium]